MRPIAFALAFVLMSVGLGIAGEYQRYVDENGVVRYSDSLTDLPKDQRTTLTTHETPDREPDTPTKSTGAPTIAPNAPTGSTASVPGIELPADTSIAETKAALDGEYNRLVAIKAQLDQELANGFSTLEETQAYHEKVSALNQRVAAFEQKRTALNQRINDNLAKKEAAKRAAARKAGR